MGELYPTDITIRGSIRNGESSNETHIYTTYDALEISVKINDSSHDKRDVLKAIKKVSRELERLFS